MGNKTLIISLGIVGTAAIGAFVAILLFYKGDQGVAIAGLVTVIGLVGGQLLTLKQVAAVHEIVNSQRTEMRNEINALKQTLANERQTTAVKEVIADRGSAPANAAALGAAQAVHDMPAGASAGETADAAALGAAEATKP